MKLTDSYPMADFISVSLKTLQTHHSHSLILIVPACNIRPSRQYFSTSRDPWRSFQPPPRSSQAVWGLLSRLLQTHQETFKAFISQAVSRQELPPSTTNLFMKYSRTSKFYLLPKRHTPGKPGRLIVSACQCPTDLLACYLDKITAPFVHNLDSYGKDSGHMLTMLHL